MSLSSPENDSSEDEIFFGPITLKEIRARLIPKHKCQAMKYANNKKDMNGSNSSIEIIEIHSEPELDTEYNLIDSPDLTAIENKLGHSTKLTDISFLRLSPNDSFLKIEKQIANQKFLEVDKFCFNDSPLQEQNGQLKSGNEQYGSLNKNSNEGLLQQNSNPTIELQTETTMKETPDKVKQMSDNIKMIGMGTLQINSHKIVSTPLTPRLKTDISKTTLSIKNQQASSIKKTPSKVNLYKHVTSPVAEYIKSKVPIIRKINWEPQPVSFIPKLKKNSVEKKSNKENIKLQSNSYQTPKKTEVTLQDEKKHPQRNNENSPTPYKILEVTARKPIDLKDDQIFSLFDLSMISEANDEIVLI